MSSAFRLPNPCLLHLCAISFLIHFCTYIIHTSPLLSYSVLVMVLEAALEEALFGSAAAGSVKTELAAAKSEEASSSVRAIDGMWVGQFGIVTSQTNRNSWCTMDGGGRG